MKSVKAGLLRKGDRFQLGRDSGIVYTVTDRVMPVDNPEWLTLSLKERGDVTMPVTAEVEVVSMFRLVTVPCVAARHNEKVEILYNMANGGAPIGVLCAECDAAITAEVMGETAKKGKS